MSYINTVLQHIDELATDRSYLCEGSDVEDINFYCERIKLKEQIYLNLMRENKPELDAEDGSLKFSDYFTYTSVLGNGAFGLVVAAEDRKNNNELCAVKVIKKNSLNLHFMDGLRREANILAQFDHPNIVKFKRIMETDTRFFLVMECIPGGQLKTLIEERAKEEKEFSEDEISSIIRGIASALDYIHTKDIVHRDLKPENILLGDCNDLSSIKVVDFGLSAHYDVGSDNRSFTEQCGTKVYMAPELFSKTQYSKPIDIWSLGIIMYQLFNQGKHPLYVPTDSFEKYKKKLLKGNIVPPEGCSELAQQLMLKLLLLDPSERYNAGQILSHPWITRILTDKIPLSLNERMKFFCNEQTMMRVIKAISFINLIRKLEGTVDRVSSNGTINDEQILELPRSNTDISDVSPSRRPFKAFRKVIEKTGISAAPALRGGKKRDSDSADPKAKGNSYNPMVLGANEKSSARQVNSRSENNSPLKITDSDSPGKLGDYSDRMITQPKNSTSPIPGYNSKKEAQSSPRGPLLSDLKRSRFSQRNILLKPDSSVEPKQAVATTAPKFPQLSSNLSSASYKSAPASRQATTGEYEFLRKDQNQELRLPTLNLSDGKKLGGESPIPGNRKNTIEGSDKRKITNLYKESSSPITLFKNPITKKNLLSDSPFYSNYHKYKKEKTHSSNSSISISSNSILDDKSPSKKKHSNSSKNLYLLEIPSLERNISLSKYSPSPDRKHAKYFPSPIPDNILGAKSFSPEVYSGSVKQSVVKGGPLIHSNDIPNHSIRKSLGFHSSKTIK